MKILLTLFVLLFSSSVLAEEFEGLFGIKIGQELNLEILDKTSNTYEPTIGFNFNLIMDLHIHTLETKDEKINKLERLKRSVKSSGWDWDYVVLPKTPNEMFEKYIVHISPLSKKIIYILAHGEMNITKCKETRKLIFDFIIDKYISSYEIKLSPFFETQHNMKLNLHKIDIINEETKGLGELNEIEVTDLRPVPNPNNAIALEITCGDNKIFMSSKDNNYFQSILMNEKSMINEMINLEIEKLTKEDLDTKGF